MCECRPGGRRSRAGGATLSRWGRCREGHHRERGDTWFARLSAVGAGPHREDCPEVGVPLPARHPCPRGYVPRRASYGNGAIRGSPAFRRAVPTGGRRSRACAPPFPGGVRVETGVIRERGDTWFARLPAGGAGPHREDCPEVGVPVPARRPFPEGYAPRGAPSGTGRYAVRPPFGGRCRPGGRRSLACVP